MRILLTGHTGYLGHHLVGALRATGVELVTGGRHDADVALDLRDARALGDAVGHARPDLVLHAAAMSSMAACADDPDAAMRRNGEAVRSVAGTGARLLFVSTDLVFDGTAAPYASADLPHPTSAYGRSKRLGEELTIAQSGLVVRLPLLFGPSHDGRHGATDMLRAAVADGRRLSLYANEFRTPLHVRDAAGALVTLALGPLATGVVHVAGPERISRFELTERFARIRALSERPWSAADADDPTRPRDVSMLSDLPTRALDEMLADA